MKHHAADEREPIDLDGFDLQLLAPGERTSGRWLRLDPGTTRPTRERHHETCRYVVRGELTVTVDGESHAAGPGDTVVVPRGEPHALANHGDEPAVVVERCAPPHYFDPPDAERPPVPQLSLAETDSDAEDG
jgi:quercetin dioxygenase-like cupin family protein